MERETFIKNNPDNENTIKLKGVTKKQIKLFKDKKLSILKALALFGGGVGLNYAFMSASGKIVPLEEDSSEELEITDEDNVNDDENNNATHEEKFDFEVPTTIEFSDAVTDDMSFAEAFRAARSDVGIGGFYNWHGSTYHTLTKEEWDALSPEERQEFFNKIQEHSDFDNGEYNKIDDNTDDEVIDDDTDTDDEAEKKDKEEADDNDKDDDTTDDKKESDEDAYEEITPDEINYDDDNIIDTFEGEDTNEKEEGYVNVDELDISHKDILDGLNDGRANSEEEGIEGGDTYNPEDYETDTGGSNDFDDIEYDNDNLDDLI